MPLILLIIILFCCQPNNNKNLTVEEGSITTELGFTKVSRVNKAVTFFSSLVKKDTFLLELKGEFITKAKINFKVISSENKTIFNEDFLMTDLYGWGPDVTNPNPDSIAIEKHLLSRFDGFFESKHFYRPAIKLEEKYLEIYNNILAEKEWKQIKDNPESIGFAYTLSEESITYIVYSEKEKRAIVYKVCC